MTRTAQVPVSLTERVDSSISRSTVADDAMTQMTDQQPVDLDEVSRKMISNLHRISTSVWELRNSSDPVYIGRVDRLYDIVKRLRDHLKQQER